MKRREYAARLTVNGLRIEKVVIDPHYELKHNESVSDSVILKLVEQLDGGDFEAEDIDDGFEYFVADRLELSGKFYKLIWLLEKGELYIGIVNAYRRK